MLFASLHSSKRKFATAQYVNKERFLSPYLHSLFVFCSFIVRLLFVFSLSACAARTVFCSSFVRSLFVFCSSFVRSFFVFCSSFVRLLFVFCSSFVRLFFIYPYGSHCLLFVHFFVSLFRYYTPSPWERAGERIFSSFFVYLPVVLRLPVRLVPACRATTSHRH